MKRCIFLLFSLMSVCFLQAQRVRVAAPKQVTVGEEFQVEYVVYTQDVRRFQLGRLSSGVEKVFGPATSSQSNYQFIDGHASSSSSVSFTYVFVATKKGSVSIGPAHIFVNGQELASTPVKIMATTGSHGSMSNGYYDTRSDSRSAASKVTAKDLFIKVSANKTTVYEQEPVLLTYKVYTTKNLRQLIGKMPDLAGFHVQEIDLPQQKTFHKERIGKRVYNCVTWSQYVMYPQMTGTLKVPPLTFHGVIQVPNSFNPFEAFGIDGGSTSFKKDVVAPELAIKVLPLPNRPANFSGGVGHFNLSAQLNKKEVKAGNPITIRVVVSGAGNLKLIKQPIIQIPKGVESYDVKVTDKTQLTTKGAEGNMIYDQVVIPHQEGLVAIPPVKFCYYDLSQKKYITLQTEPMDLVVSRGDGSSKDILSVDLPNEDILPLKKGDSTLDNIGNLFFGSTVYYIILILLLSIGGGLAFYYRNRFAYRVDMVFKRGKNANRIASSRLRAAELLMLKNKNLDFYDEVLQTLWGYASDKLNLPVEHLSRENLSEQFSKIDIAKEVIDNYISAIDECEFERYAPGDEKGNMKRTLTVAMKAIADMEEAIKKLKSSKKKAFLFLPLLFCLSFFFSAQLSAQTKSDVDNLYQKGNYVQAVKGYEKLLKQGESAALYYNLGNCYYRLDNIPHAVLSYERAQRLAPSDEDIRFNLQLAQSKTIDNLTPESEMIFVTWYKALVNLFSIDSWAYLSLVCLFISIVALVVYLFVDIEILRKLSKIVLPLFFFFFLINTFFAIQQVYLLDSETHGIIMSPSAVVRKMPDQKSADSFILHEGSKVRIIDNSMSQWTEIKLSDGRQGWIKADNVEAI